MSNAQWMFTMLLVGFLCFLVGNFVRIIAVAKTDGIVIVRNDESTNIKTVHYKGKTYVLRHIASVEKHEAPAFDGGRELEQ
jgi:hypothetical protein